MKIYHLNCATMCPFMGRYFGSGAYIVCHCLLVETNNGLVLVDTGFGLADVQNFGKRVGRMVKPFLGPKLDPAETAIAQVEKLGFSAKDVRHIIPTHLDLDHAGGLADFPHAQVHIYKQEYDAITNPSWREYLRYCFRQWDHHPNWQIYDEEGESWFSFHNVQQLKGLPAEILLVPTVGHSRGHCAIAVKKSEGWLLHAGDAYFYHGELAPKTKCPLIPKFFQWFIQYNGHKRLKNQQRLRELANNNQEVKVFCAHDVKEFNELRSCRH